MHVCQPADLSLVLNCCSRWHVKSARKMGEEEPPPPPPPTTFRRSPLTCARQPRRARQPHAHSIHSDAARRILLNDAVRSRVIPHLQFLRYSDENRNKFTTMSRCGAHARNCAPPRRGFICLGAAGQTGGKEC